MARAKMLLVEDDAALAELPDVRAFLWTGADGRLEDWSVATADGPWTPVPDESAGTDLLYSSGTTGRPKGVMPALPTCPHRRSIMPRRCAGRWRSSSSAARWW